LAAKQDNLEFFNYLAKIGADINIPDAERNTALHHAAISGSVDIIRFY
jgi:ankyrin repeat protein